MSIPFDSALSGTISPEALMSETDQPDNVEQSNNGRRVEMHSFIERVADGLAPQATRYAMSIVRRWCDAEEIVQEAFFKLWQAGKLLPAKISTESGNVDEERLDLNSRALLFTTVRNLAIDQLRCNGRRRFEAIDTSQLPNRKNDTDGQRLVKLETAIEEILSTLPEQWAESLQLKVNAGLSYAEIGKIVGGTHAQIRTWIYRARKQLSLELKQRGLLESGEPNHE